MSDEGDDEKARKAEAILLVVTSRERAPRPPRLERALKRLIWRYSHSRPPKEAEPEQPG